MNDETMKRLQELKAEWDKTQNTSTTVQNISIGGSYHYHFGHGACPCCGRCRCCGNGHGFYPYYPSPWITWTTAIQNDGTTPHTSGLLHWS